MPNKQKENSDEPGWSYNPHEEDGESDKSPAKRPARQKDRSINWTASEFVEVQRTGSWRIYFATGLILLCVLVFLLTKDYASLVFIAVAGVIFLIASGRKPRQLTYEVNDKGVQVGANFYPYEVFKSFDLVQEGAIRNLSLMPMKRFMPEISIYFPPEQEASIIEIVSSHLPHDEHFEKTIDKVARKLQF